VAKQIHKTLMTGSDQNLSSGFIRERLMSSLSAAFFCIFLMIQGL